MRQEDWPLQDVSESFIYKDSLGTNSIQSFTSLTRSTYGILEFLLMQHIQQKILLTNCGIISPVINQLIAN